MGTWGEGLYDNDSALDVITEICEGISLDSIPAHLLVGTGLTLWFCEFIPEGCTTELKEHEGWESTYPEAAQALKETSKWNEIPTGNRSKKLLDILGNYCNGPRIDAFLSCKNGEPVLREFVKLCCEHLREHVSPEQDLYELSANLAPLGMLLEMKQANLKYSIPSSDLKKVEEAFNQADELTDEERDFWDNYVLRVRSLFRLLQTP